FYITLSVGSVIRGMIALANQAFIRSLVTPAILGQEIYGPVVRWFTYGYWALFVALAVFLVKRGVLRESNRLPSILGGLAIVFVSATLISSRLEFSAGRGYTIGALLVSIVVPLGLLRSFERVGSRSRRLLKLTASIVVVVFVIVSVAKLPAYIGGGMSPVRGGEPIDGVPYWRIDADNFAAAEFLNARGVNLTLYAHMLVVPFDVLSLYERGMVQPPASLDFRGHLIPGAVRDGSLVLLQNG